MDLSLGSSDVEVTRRHRVARIGRWDAWAIAAFAAVLSSLGAARPSLWYDEAATISAASRPVGELWLLLGNVDAVHGLYYLVMHGWLEVLPATEFWIRVPSCLAVGAAAAGVVVLAGLYAGRTVAVTAGVVFAILPRVTWAAVEARPYALSMAGAVWLTVLLVNAVRRDRRTWWVAYAAAIVASTLLNLFTVLVVLPHAVAVVGNRRSVRRRWLVAVVSAVTALIPYAVFCRTQKAQVGWISPLSAETWSEVGYEQYFDHSAAFAVTVAALVAMALATRRITRLDTATRGLVALAAAWVVLPTATLLAYSALSDPVYHPRYLSFTAPAAALLIAVCVVSLARAFDRVAAILVLLAVAATPNFVFVQRGPYAKEGMDFSQVADLLTAKADAGDCLVLDNTVTWKPGPIRPITAARPAAYEDLVDPGRGMRAVDRNRLWDAHVAIWAVADRVQRCTVIWTVSDRDPTLGPYDAGVGVDPGPRMRRAPAYLVQTRLGFQIVERWQFNFAQVTRSAR